MESAAVGHQKFRRQTTNGRVENKDNLALDSRLSDSVRAEVELWRRFASERMCQQLTLAFGTDVELRRLVDIFADRIEIPFVERFDDVVDLVKMVAVVDRIVFIGRIDSGVDFQLHDIAQATLRHPFATAVASVMNHFVIPKRIRPVFARVSLRRDPHPASHMHYRNDKTIKEARHSYRQSFEQWRLTGFPPQITLAFLLLVY